MAFVVDIESKTLKNKNYRKVINTNPKQQLVVMSLEPGEDIPLEPHMRTSQFIRVEKGTGVAIIGKTKKKKIKLKDGMAITIPPKTWHYVKNNGSGPLKLYTIYSPPEHAPKTSAKRQNVMTINK